MFDFDSDIRELMIIILVETHHIYHILSAQIIPSHK